MTTPLSPSPATPAKARVVIHRVRVEFGDCDPARIVWFPNFFRWIDAASRNFFMACGVPPWHETEKTLGVLGTPLVDTHARFVKTASYGDILDIHTQIAEWRDKSFVQRYQIYRGDDLIMACDEVRIFAAHREGASDGSSTGSAIRAVAIPPSIRSLCE
jgi:4-hydroxybenzoyl-CoA thioesterase